MRDLHNAYVVAEYEVWPSMLSKKLAMVKDYVIVHCANNQFGGGGYTKTGEVWISDVNFFVGDLHNAYVVANYEFWSSMLWKKLAMVKDCNCGNSQLGRGVLTDRGRYGKRMVNFRRRPLQCLCCGEI